MLDDAVVIGMRYAVDFGGGVACSRFGLLALAVAVDCRRLVAGWLPAGDALEAGS